MKIKLLTYADSNYAELQKSLEKKAIDSGVFDQVISRTRKDLEQSSFYEGNQHILDEKRGAGYWLWKPFFIEEALSLNLNENDILVYMDCGDSLEETNDMRDALLKIMSDKDILLTAGAFKNSDWTKRDTFVNMGCDTEKFHNAIQVEAGIIVCKNTGFTRNFITQWLSFCMQKELISDDANICGLPNIEGFKDHRHDQSILTNLAIMELIPVSNEMRKYIHCNKNKTE